MVFVKKVARALLPNAVAEHMQFVRTARRSLQPLAKRSCNICGFHGWFEAFGRPPRLDARCPKCRSLERHRLMMLALDRGVLQNEPSKILHFAPEEALRLILQTRWGEGYSTADLYKPADLKLDLEAIDLPDESVDLIIASHVLEHVDDSKASRELSRILRQGGILVCMVPIIEGWRETYENPTVTSEELRLLHFGQEDHLRFYGEDFRKRIADGGFDLIEEVTAEGEDVIRHGLWRGEKVFIFQKAATRG